MCYVYIYIDIYIHIHTYVRAYMYIGLPLLARHGPLLRRPGGQFK